MFHSMPTIVGLNKQGKNQRARKKGRFITNFPFLSNTRATEKEITTVHTVTPAAYRMVHTSIVPNPSVEGNSL